ncbi:hypothetical protein DIPPA_27790 [Diplonema papillatum]|nr:hypothetical protein DIPPA_27790 [Diplonema papillatum]
MAAPRLRNEKVKCELARLVAEAYGISAEHEGAVRGFLDDQTLGAEDAADGLCHFAAAQGGASPSAQVAGGGTAPELAPLPRDGDGRL